jgi:membrane-associated phospholipid phosphatase
LIKEKEMEGLVNFEILFTTLVQNFGTWLETPMRAFTFLGSEIFFLLVMPALYWSIDPKIGFRAGMMLVISGGLNTALKMFIHTPRPYWVDGSVKAFSSETSFGLPSGHSQNSAAIWGMVAQTMRKRSAIIIAAIVVFFIGFSRIYLGVHFLHDVLTGWLIGILLILLYVKLEKPVGNYIQTKSLCFQLLAALMFSMLLILLGTLGQSIENNWKMPIEWINNAVSAGADAPDPFNLEGMITIAGVAFGFLVGFALWRFLYDTYEINCSPMKRLLRYLVGLVGIFILYFGLKLLLPEEPLMIGIVIRYARYALIGFWVTFLAPWLFRRLHLDV